MDKDAVVALGRSTRIAAASCWRIEARKCAEGTMDALGSQQVVSNRDVWSRAKAAAWMRRKAARKLCVGDSGCDGV